MGAMRRLSLAVLAVSFAVYTAGCTHVRVTRTDLAPSDAASFNSAARGKPYVVQVKEGRISEGRNGLAMRLSPKREWLLSTYGTPPNRMDVRNISLDKVETIRIFEGSRKSASRGFGEGALLGLATGACMGAILGAATHDEDNWLFDRGDEALLGGIAGGVVGALLGGVVGVIRGSTIETESVYSPQRF